MIGVVSEVEGGRRKTGGRGRCQRVMSHMSHISRPSPIPSPKPDPISFPFPASPPFLPLHPTYLAATLL